jgi:hypothetical protein
MITITATTIIIITITTTAIIITITERDRCLIRRPSWKTQTKKNPPMAGVNNSSS